MSREPLIERIISHRRDRWITFNEIANGFARRQPRRAAR